MEAPSQTCPRSEVIDGPPCGAPVEKRLIIEIAAPLPSNVTVRSVATLAVCASCAAKTEIDEVVTIDSWAAICFAFGSAHRAMPDRTRSTIDWIDVGSEEDIWSKQEWLQAAQAGGEVVPRRYQC